MSGDITIRANRVDTMRQLAAKIRKDKDTYDAAQKAMPSTIESVRTAILKSLADHEKVIRKAKTLQELYEAAGRDVMDYKKRNEFPPQPRLRVCEAKSYLDMFQRDTREIIPINSNSELWQLLQPPCEVK